MKNILAMSCLLLLFAVPAMADSISPASYSATLGIGDSVTIRKTVTVDDAPPVDALVDVFFLADTTGSMGSVLSSVAASAGSILTSASSLGDVAFGVGEYKDSYDAYAYRLNQDITKDLGLVQDGIDLWTAGGGDDWPEAQLFALKEVAEGTSWRTDSARVVVWFGDAPGHDPDAVAGVTEAAAIAALQAEGISVEAIATDTYYSATEGGLDSTGQATRIAAATGGHVYPGIDDTSVVAAINDAITAAFSTYTTVGLDVLAPVGVTVGYVPAGHVGAFDRSVVRTFDFDVTFTGDLIGDYSFPIYATVDGGRVALEKDRIKVVPVPAAFLLGMLGLSVAGARLRKRS